MEDFYGKMEAIITSSPDYHINEDGVGYLIQTSYTEDPGNGDPRLHTMFFKKTEDYGETWTNDGGYKNSGYHFIPDEVMMELLIHCGQCILKMLMIVLMQLNYGILEQCVILSMKSLEILWLMNFIVEIQCIM